MSVTATEVIKTIQRVKNVQCPQMKFLISLAFNAYKYGGLTEKQTEFYEKAIESLKENNNL